MVGDPCHTLQISSSALQCRSVARDASHAEIKEEESLLVEAVSLLVQRQREAESWVAEQIWQAEERAATTERRYSDLEARLIAIEDQLGRLIRDVEPSRSDAVVDERLARLREQVEGLKSENDGRPALDPRPVVHEPEPLRSVAPPAPPPAPRSERAPQTAGNARPQEAGVLDLMGSTPQDRLGFALIGLGGVAVLYALLTQVHFG